MTTTRRPPPAARNGSRRRARAPKCAGAARRPACPEPPSQTGAQTRRTWGGATPERGNEKGREKKDQKEASEHPPLSQRRPAEHDANQKGTPSGARRQQNEGGGPTHHPVRAHVTSPPPRAAQASVRGGARPSKARRDNRSLRPCVGGAALQGGAVGRGARQDPPAWPVANQPE